MPYQTITQGLTITVPTDGTRNWGQVLYDSCWVNISAHDHTADKGNLIGTNALATDAVTTIKITDQNVTTAKIADLNVTTGKIAAEAVTSDKLAKNIGSTVVATVTPSGTTQTIDFNAGLIHQLDLGSATGDVTLTLSNPVAGAIYRIYVTQAATPRDIIWPAGVKWPGGQKPLLSQVNDAIDSVTLVHIGAGIYYGEWDLAYV